LQWSKSDHKVKPVIARGEEIFRREGAANSDEMFVAGEVR
jgi:hypothetical protein